MKNEYKSNLLLKLLKLPALIFFLLALSYNVKAQYADPQFVCYGSPINLYCGGLYGCDLPDLPIFGQTCLAPGLRMIKTLLFCREVPDTIQDHFIYLLNICQWIVFRSSDCLFA